MSHAGVLGLYQVKQHVADMQSVPRAVLKQWLLVQIHFISASCENMIDGRGMLPGDVLTASNGKTVEVSQLCGFELLYLGNTPLPSLAQIPKSQSEHAVVMTRV